MESKVPPSRHLCRGMLLPDTAAVFMPRDVQ